MEPGPGDVPRKFGRRVARFGRSMTAEAAGEVFRSFASARALAEVFELVKLLLGMLEGCREKTDEMQRNPKRWIGHDRHGGDNSGRGGGEYLCR